MPRYNTSFITVRTFDTHEPLVGRIQDSRMPRSTEISALQRIAFGVEIPASDTIRELRDKGYRRCGRCGIYKDPDAFTVIKHKDREATYRQSYCKHCRAEMMRTKRWSVATVILPYSARVG